MVADGGVVDIAQAKTIAEIAGFSDGSSSFDVTDLSTGIIGEAGAAGGGIIAASFVATVRATDATPDQAITLVGIDSVDTFAMDAGSYTDLTVDQVRAVEDGKNETAVSYTVLDDASVIEGAISDIDNADEVSSSETLTLTVAEFDALDDDDTDLMTAYDIVDDAATRRRRWSLARRLLTVRLGHHQWWRGQPELMRAGRVTERQRDCACADWIGRG